MQELRRNLSEKQNVFSRLFHVEMKDLVEHGLKVMSRLPSPGVGDGGQLERYNSREFVNIRNYALLCLNSENEKNLCIVNNIFNFLIMLYDSDDAWCRMIYKVILKIKETEFKPEEEPHEQYWRESDG